MGNRFKNKAIVHFCHLDKFIPPFVDFINQNFGDSRHLFIIYGVKSHFLISSQKNVISLSDISKFAEFVKLFTFLKVLIKSEKIVFHGLFNMRLYQFLFLQPWILKKSHWVIWGGDLYIKRPKLSGCKSKINEYVRKSVIKRMGFLVTGTNADAEFCRERYAARGLQIKSFNYPSNIFIRKDLESKGHNGINILVGNSADSTNNHAEIFDVLLPYKYADIKIYCPLSYGDKEYAVQVVNEGKKFFGNKFCPLLNFMDASDYKNLLSEIDIALFAHDRQQAFGNKVWLLGMGKTVYMKKTSGLWRVFSDLGVVVNELNEFNLKINSKVATQNMEIIETQFSEKAMIDNLKSWIN